MTRCNVSVFTDDADRTARSAALSFYKQLRKSGLSREQILAIAQDLTGRLAGTVERFRDKLVDERIASPTWDGAEAGALH
jgi:hypothetical protein